VQVGFERVQHAGPHVAGQQRITTAGAEVAAHGLVVQIESAGDCPYRQARSSSDTSIEWVATSAGVGGTLPASGWISDVPLGGIWMTPPPAVRGFRAGSATDVDALETSPRQTK